MRRNDGKRGGGSATLADVARLAGVSPSTVSRVINEPGLVRQDTIDVVRRAIAQIGYTPNSLAGGLASNRTKLVAVLVPTIANSIFADTVQAITDRLSADGYQALIGLTAYDVDKEDDLIQAVIGRRPDGLILTGTVHSPITRARLLAANFPIVEMWDVSPTPIDMAVGFSHPAVGRALAGYLHGKGRRNFGLLFATDQRALARQQALSEELVRLGCAPPRIALVPPANNISYGHRGLAELLDGGDPLDAVVCSSDALALGALSEAKDRGIAVPDSLAVMGFGDLDFGSFTAPPLSTVHVDRAMIGREAASALLARLRGTIEVPPVLDVGFRLIERASA